MCKSCEPKFNAWFKNFISKGYDLSVYRKYFQEGMRIESEIYRPQDNISDILGEI